MKIKTLLEPNTEEELQGKIIELLKIVYPKILVKGNYLSGVELYSRKGAKPYKQIRKVKKLSGDRYFPDLEILQPANGFCGLFIELKRKHSSAFLKDGSFSNNEEGKRAKLQAEYGEKLKNAGYWFEFGIGLHDSWQKIADYLKE